MGAEETWSVDAGKMMQMTTDAEVSAATTAEHVSKISEEEAARNPDALKKGKLTNLKQKADEKDEPRFAHEEVGGGVPEVFDQTKSTAGAATDMKSAAQFDKPKSKGAADTAADTAGTMTPGENGEAISKAASASATDAPGSCGGSIRERAQGFLATLADRPGRGGDLAAAHKKAASAKTADSVSKLHWAGWRRTRRARTSATRRRRPWRFAVARAHARVSRAARDDAGARAHDGDWTDQRRRRQQDRR